MANTIQKFSDEVQKRTLKNLIYGMNSASDNNIIRLLKVLKLISPKQHKNTLEELQKSFKNNAGIIKFLRRVLSEPNKKWKDMFLMNLIAQGLILNTNKRNKILKEGSHAPTTVLVSPTMRCNLRCTGCYAANYSKKDDMDFKTFDRIVSEGKEMGVGFYTILGGETLVYRDLFKIFQKHKDAFFQFYTNATLMTDKVVKELSELGNATPMISIEGWEKETDARRGKGTYKKIISAMKKLKDAGIPFGISVAVTSKNADIVASDKFMDLMVDSGAYFCWWFLYMPLGRKPDIKLMPTPKQRVMLYKNGRHIRDKYPIFLVDFWNDAPYVGGCIAGREYIHINSKGDVEPCIFTHFAADNIKNKSLVEVMNSEYFRELRRRQPYNDNLYMPCMWIDNPDVSREIHTKFNVYPTHPDAECIITDKKTIKHMDKYSKEIEKEYGKLWKKDKKFFCDVCRTVK